MSNLLTNQIKHYFVFQLFYLFEFTAPFKHKLNRLIFPKISHVLAPGFWDDQQHAAVGDRRSRQARSKRDLARSGSLGGAGGDFDEVIGTITYRNTSSDLRPRTLTSTSILTLILTLIAAS